MMPEFTDIRQTPLGFVKHVLGARIYDGTNGKPDWQARPLIWFETPLDVVRGSIVAPNGSGRTSMIVAPLSLALAALHPKATVVIMLPDGVQLDQQTWVNLLAYKSKLPPEWRWNYREITTPSGSRIIGRATDEASRAEGFHKLPDDIEGPLYIIVDEAKSMAPEIYQAIDKCTYNGLLLVSSPGEERGEFWESQTKRAHMYKRIAVGLTDCPHIKQERIDYLREKYKHDPEYLAATLYGQFMKQEGGTRYILSVSSLALCRRSSPPFQPGWGLGAFCDFAGGGDENVLAVRQGNRVTIPAAWREYNEYAAVSRFIAEFRKVGLKANQIWGDADGAGKAMCAIFDELGWPINRFHGGSAAKDNDYYNRIAEIWHTGARQIADAQIILPDDGLLDEQLTSRMKVYRTDGRIGIERKEDMKKRGVESPDRADAVLGALAIEQPERDPFARDFLPRQSRESMALSQMNDLRW